nr:DNA repair protein RadA [Xenorhabdus bovienii]
MAAKGSHIREYRVAKAVKRAFVCNECGADYPRWQGQCTACHAWNTITEVRLAAASSSRSERFSGYAGEVSISKVQKLAEISLEELPRFSTGFKEFDRVLGGGVVPGSAILIGGNPGAGKSTLLLQTMCQLSEQMKTLYVTGEESLQQVAMRAHRLGLPTDKLNMLSETSIEQICLIAEQEQPKLMVIDSIQVMHMADIQSSPGSVAQVRETAAYLTRFAKTRGVAIIMVGHVTKDGSLAGPKVLEHCIDCSVMLDGEADSRFRTLRSHKNRFGAVNELGVFAMTEQGLREVSNPSAIFLSRGDEVTSGSSVMVVWEGTRPLLVEVQALVDHSMLSNPRRVAVGLEQNRLAILLAVLHRHGGLQMADQDVFVNVVGGVKVTETSADLALLLSLVSSFRDRPLPRDLMVFGEVGLAGEIRPVPSGQERISEAAKHGFKRAIVPHANMPKKALPEMKVFGVKKLADALSVLDELDD